MSGIDDLLDFSFDEDFAPSRRDIPDGKATGVLGNIGDPKITESGEWMIVPCTFEIDDKDYLELAKRTAMTMTYDLVLALDPATGKPKVPASADDEVNNNYRRFAKALGGTTKDKFSTFIGKRATLIIKSVPMKDRDKQVMLDDEGNPRMRAKVVAVGKAG